MKKQKEAQVLYEKFKNCHDEDQYHARLSSFKLAVDVTVQHTPAMVPPEIRKFARTSNYGKSRFERFAK